MSTRAYQCPGCWSVSVVEELEGGYECDCGEKLTVIDLRYGATIGPMHDASMGWDPQASRICSVLVSPERMEILCHVFDVPWVREALAAVSGEPAMQVMVGCVSKENESRILLSPDEGLAIRDLVVDGIAPGMGEVLDNLSARITEVLS